jgi:hypothetical protein
LHGFALWAATSVASVAHPAIIMAAVAAMAAVAIIRFDFNYFPIIVDTNRLVWFI